jgi:hypothetical protein
MYARDLSYEFDADLAVLLCNHAIALLLEKSLGMHTSHATSAMIEHISVIECLVRRFETGGSACEYRYDMPG